MLAAEEVAMEFESEKVVATVGSQAAMAAGEVEYYRIVLGLGFDSGCLGLREGEDLLVFVILTALDPEAREMKGHVGCLQGSAVVGCWPFCMMRCANEEEKTL